MQLFERHGRGTSVDKDAFAKSTQVWSILASEQAVDKRC